MAALWHDFRRKTLKCELVHKSQAEGILRLGVPTLFGRYIVFIKTMTIALVPRWVRQWTGRNTVWRLDTFRSRSRAAMAAASTWARKRSDAAALCLRSSLRFSPIWWLGAKLWAGVCTFGRLVQWFLVPKGDTPLDFLKHYVSVLIVLIGAGALLWSAKQIAYPPLVITVAKLPEPLEKEYWLNPELSRALIGQIERLRAAVKGERDPAFDAVLNPPNIIVRTGEWSLNVQEQILTPLGSLLGRGQGEVHLALNCYHPGCARTTDKECREIVPLRESESKTADTKTAEGKTKQYLCLRLTTDIQRGLSHRRLTPRLVVSPDDAEMTDAMARVAEAVTTVADPATATLYFYRRIREEKRNPGVAPDLIADLVSEASKAAEEAETNDAVSACWAHTVRAHLAVDRGEFRLAAIYLARARNISLWSHLGQATSPSNCKRLIVIAEMEFARHLSREPQNETYPPHPENTDRVRVEAAFKRAQGLLDDQRPGTWARIFGNSPEDEDLSEALKLVQAEIGLSWYPEPDQCKILDAALGGQASVGDLTVDTRANPPPSSARRSVKDAIEKLGSLRPEEQLATLTRQAALDFMSRFAQNSVCTERVVAILQKLELNHPNDPRLTQLLIAITEAAGLRKTASLNRPAEEQDRGNRMIEFAQKIYQRLVATGADRSGSALTRLAVFSEARSAEEGEDSKAYFDETLQNLKRAWQRHERDINASRDQGELIVSIWGMALLRFYPPAILTTDFSHASDEDIVSAEYRGALARKAEFEAALRTLYPTAHPLRLADLPHLKEIGPRIGCLCMLSYVTQENELQDFFIGRVDKWQKQKPDQTACRRDLIPATQTTVPQRLRTMVSQAKKQVEAAEKKLEDAEPKTKELQDELEKKKDALQLLQEQLSKAQTDAPVNLERFKKKSETVTTAAEICYVTPPAPPAASAAGTPPAPPSP